MTEFFKSEQVRAALAELAEIQDDLAHTMASPRLLSDDEKKDYVRKLKLFLELYLVFYFLFSTTESIKPNFLASSAVIKLSLSKASDISLIVLPVCFE